MGVMPFFLIFNCSRVYNKCMAWIIESNRIPTEVIILKETRDFITVQIKGTEGAIRLRRSRIFKTKEDALKSIKDSNNSGSNHHGPFGH